MARLDAYMTDINQRIDSMEDKLMIAIRKDMKKMLKNKAEKEAKAAKEAQKIRGFVPGEKDETIDIDDIEDELDTIIPPDGPR